jgi:membrane glycosyltransferase
MAMEGNSSAQIAVGAIGGGLVGALFANGLDAAFGPEFVVRVLAGGAAGWLCGLIPYFAGRSKDREFALKSVWICIGSGMVLGLILALPVAIVSGVLASRRSPVAVAQLVPVSRAFERHPAE